MIGKLLALLTTLTSFIVASDIQAPVYAQRNMELDFIERPLCMLGDQYRGWSKRRKVRLVRKHQRRISRRTRMFMRNKKLETKGKLVGSPKYLTLQYLKEKGLNLKQIEFTVFAMTLFSEAKNLSEKDMGMVARVINNRRGNGTYLQTVTELAQFSAWYYKNQHDNAVLLCPGKQYDRLWEKTVKVAAKHFYKKDPNFKATHYFAPRNMSPRYRIPRWAKGRYAVAYGAHVFLVSKDFEPEEDDKEVIYIQRNKRRMKVKEGKIFL